MLILQTQDLSYRYETMLEPLFLGVSINLYTGDKVALLGHNGSGKTTLLNLLKGELEPTDGDIILSGNLHMLRQEDRLEGDATVLEALLSTHKRFFELYLEMTRLEQEGMAEPLRYADGVAAFSELGGFDLLTEITQMVTALGFDEMLLKTSVTQLSGGERRLLKLMSAFLLPPDLLILDEPSNYLDERAISFLIEKIQAFSGACLIVSHDRWFLDQTVAKVLELEHRRISEYKGDYSTFRATKDGIFREKVRKKEKLETEIDKLEAVERTYKVWGARKEKEKSGAMDKGFIGARAAKLQKRGIMAKERMQDRIETLKETKPWIDKHYQIAFEKANVPSGTCLLIQDLSFAYEEPLLEKLSLTLEWGERLALSGSNGSGKSTLIKLMLTELKPQAGKVMWSKRVELAYLPQLWTDPAHLKTVAELFSEDESPQARLMLGALRVKGDLFFQPFSALSEGQKRKLRLVRLMLDKPNVLILDEPTTHLDYESVEMLESALEDYSGTLILVTHDKYLRERLCDRELNLSQAGSSASKV